MNLSVDNAEGCWKSLFIILIVRLSPVLIVAATILRSLYLHLIWLEQNPMHQVGLVVAEKNVAKRHLVQLVIAVPGGENVKKIILEPKYSTVEIPGKCLKCLAEQEYGDCLRDLLKGEAVREGLEEKFEAMLALLKSSEITKLRDESEKYLADGKKVRLVIHKKGENTKYEIKLD